MVDEIRRILRRLRSRWGPALQSDTDFIEAAFREILGRNADLDGLNHYRRVLREGLGRTAVLLEIMRSEEFRATLTKGHSGPPLPDLTAQRPASYRRTVDRSNGQPITVFDAIAPADFDWLEAAILQHGYYEQPGVWVLGVDADKRVIAELIAAFEPARALELGCAAGAVLQCLDELGIEAEGVEISSMAIARAPARVRTRIHQGDLLNLDLPPVYDLVFGLDVFEHLNPNRIDAYLSRITAVATRDAFAFCNIPMFGHDDIFGTVFPLYIDGWERDAAAGRPFSALHVDELGYPLHGHLTLADTAWWSGRFAAHGWRREPDVERALHAKYDAHFEKRAPARKPFFVLSRGNGEGRRSAVIQRITTEPSRALGDGKW